MDTLTRFISAPALATRMGCAQQPLLVDVRRHEAFSADMRMIAGATWRDPFAIDGWLKFLPRHREVVVYCVHGHEISQNACQALRAANINAFALAGGMQAWQANAGMTIRKNAALSIPSVPNVPSRWITRERPKIDRVACPWLIRRFIDPCAEFLYVPATDVLTRAKTDNAIAYDVPGVTFTHRGDHGERCSFDALLEDFEMHDSALHQLASIVRGADTGQIGLTPQSHGLLAISIGLSALYHNDDDMLNQGMVVYDALYAWLKTAHAEIHNADLFKEKT